MHDRSGRRTRADRRATDGLGPDHAHTFVLAAAEQRPLLAATKARMEVRALIRQR